MKQDVILGPRLRRHERAGDGRGSTREHYRPRRNGERQRHRGGKSDWHQWSLEAIMQRFADCCRQIHDQLASCTVRGITVTTFGVDGALVDEQGALLYPIISWKCPRTAAVMEKISQYMPARQLQRIAGVGAFAFNTLYKLVWLKENHPQLLAQAHASAVYFIADQPSADRGVHHRPHHGGHQPDARSPAARFQRADPAGDRPAAPPVPAAG